MRRRCYKECYGYILLFILTAVTVGVCVVSQGMFGAEVDWISQHSVLPDYFRKQFYDTGELFPEFALNIGGGQNIYHFSYYGLYSPLLLISYLLPFVKMSDYMMLVQFVCLSASVILMYVWLKRRGFKESTAFGTACLFLAAGPMIYHSYHQIMFVNYMPFLCMGFLGTDRYFGQMGAGSGERFSRKIGLLMISVFLMIMTSFYFSIGGMLVLVLYGSYRYFEVREEGKEKITFVEFITEGMRFLVPFVLAVLLSGVLLCPTAAALLGREGTEKSVNLSELLIPHLSLDRFFYSPYGIGLTTLSVSALVSMLFFPKRCEKILAWGCVIFLTIPVFSWLLNGGLYVRNKALIPFLPLLCYVTAYYLDRAELKTLRRLFPYLIPLLLVLCLRGQGDAGQYWMYLLLDGGIMLLCAVVYVRKGHPLLMLLPSIVFLLGVSGGVNFLGGQNVDREFYKEVTSEDIGKQITKAAEEEEAFCRIEQIGSDKENAANLNRIWDMRQYVSSIYSSSYNSDYQKFRKEVFCLEEPFRNFLMKSVVRNPVFLRFMGVKYIVSKEDVPGYELTKREGDSGLYVNKEVSPIAYATDQIMSEKEYEKLEFPYRQTVLLKYAVVKENADTEEDLKADAVKRIKEDVKPAELYLPRRVSLKENKKVIVPISETKEKTERKEQVKERVLFLKFQVKNLKPSKDVAVWAGGERNKLTSKSHFYYNDNTVFHFAVPLKRGQDSVEMVFGEGKYEISEVECFMGTLPDNTAQTEAGEASLYQSEFKLDWKKTAGNVTAGDIDVEHAGYFITSIPYDKNFEICVDKKEVQGEKVNQAFLGFKIGSGRHEIQIIYHAPGMTAGKIMSVLGLFLTAALSGPALINRLMRRSRTLSIRKN